MLTGLAIEREQGPSWARPNWPVAELDAVNLGLDPTEATIEKVAREGQGRGRCDRRRPTKRRSAAPPTTASGR